MSYVVAEIKWYLSGNNRPDEIAKHAKVWSRITNNNGFVNSNYGNKIFFHGAHKYMSQFDICLGMLRKNIYSRRAFLFFHMYPDDYMKMYDTLDYPCTIYAQFLMNEGKLDFLVNMRSNDLIYGWCNDVPFFTLVQEMMATLLDVPIGQYHHHAGSLHIYERHYELFNNIGKIVPKTPEDQTPFEPLTHKDVVDLLYQKYDSDTPFMKSFRKWEVKK